MSPRNRVLLSFSPDHDDSLSPFVSPPLLMAFANFLANALLEKPKKRKREVAEKKNHYQWVRLLVTVIGECNGGKGKCGVSGGI